MRSLPAVTLALLLASPLLAQSLPEARQLADQGQPAEARATLEAILASAGSEADRPAALLLLGEVLVAEGRYADALPRWRELAELHPGSDEAARVGARLPLLQALVECRGEAAAAAAPTPPSAEQPAAGEPGAEALATPAAPEPPPTPAGAEAGPAPRPSAAGGLLVGAWGDPYEASQQTAAVILDFLTESGVTASAASTEIPAIRGADAVLGFLLQEAEERGADGLLFVTTRYGFREFVRVERFDPAGARLWDERVAGGTALKEGYGRDHMNDALVERLIERLKGRLGTPDLPTRP